MGKFATGKYDVVNKSKFVVLLRDPCDEILSSTAKKIKDINDKNHSVCILN